MRMPSWRQWINNLGRAKRGPTSKRRRKAPSARLSLRRLEERRVLNGVPVAVAISDDQGAVVVEAAPADGSADVFQVIREGNDDHPILKISANGTVVYESELDKVSSIKFEGSSDDESLVIDFSNGDPIPGGGISIAGASNGGTDTLQLVNGSAGSVSYSFGGPGDGQITIGAGANSSTIQFSGSVQQITDDLAAADRSFSTSGDVHDLTLQAAVMADMSHIDVSSSTHVDFEDPTASLTIDTTAVTSATIDVHGLGSGFQANLSIAAAADAKLSFSGATELGTGSLSASAGQIEVAGTVTTAGGMIELNAAGSFTLGAGGGLWTIGGSIYVGAPEITAAGTISAPDGGTIRLDAGPQGTVLVSGTLDASAAQAGMTGGTVDVLGAYVGLIDSAHVDVSGAAGGGLVHIGGDYQGANPDVHNALRVAIGADVTISADALSQGAGGRVVVWSDELTGFYGTITARGGSLGGDGGFVEVSSAVDLWFRGTVDLRASAGATGTLLLDPLTVTIVNQNGGANDNQLNANVPNPGNPAFAIFFDDLSGSNFTISETALEAATANIVIQARNSILIDDLTTDGVLLLPVNIGISLSTRNTPAFGDSATGGVSFANAANRIETQGTGNITIQAGSPFSAAAVADATLGGLKTAGGVINVLATRNVTMNGTVDSAGGVVSLQADSNSNGTGSLTIAAPISGAVHLSAGNGISIQASVTSTGDFTADADANDDSLGTFVVGAGGSVNSTSHAMELHSADIDLAGTLNSGASTISLYTKNFRTIGVGDPVADYSLSGAELQNITAAFLRIGGSFFGEASGNILVGGISAADTVNIGTLTLLVQNPTGSISFVGTPSTFKNLGLESTGDVTIAAPLTTTGAISIKTDTDGDNVGIFSIAPGGSLNTSGQDLLLQTIDINLQGDLNAGAGTISLFTKNGRTIGLGNAAGDYTLTGAELQHIIAANLIIGGNLFGDTNGNITVDGVAVLDTAGISGTVTLQYVPATGGISFVGAASTFKNLALISANDIILGTALTTTGSVSINADADLSNAGVFRIAAGGSLDTSGHDVAIRSADIDLQGDLHAGAGTVSLLTKNERTIGIGTAVGDYTVSGAELQHIFAGNLVVGGSFFGEFNGDITVSGVTAAQSANIAGTVSLLATSGVHQIAFSGSSSIFRGLSASASNGIDVDVDLTTTSGNLSMIGDTNSTPNGNDAIAFAPGVTLSSAGSISLRSLNGGLSAAGDLKLLAANGITLRDVFVAAGPLTMNADTDNNGTGTFTSVNGSITTAAQPLSIAAADIGLAGTLNSGAADTSLFVTGGRTAYIGNGGVATDYRLGGAELQRITAANLSIGGSSGGSIFVDGISAANSGNITGLVTLLASSAGSDITFQGSASTFRALTGTAADAIAVNAPLDMTTGDLFLESITSLVVNQPLQTAGPAGGALTVIGPVVINAAITVGTGNITLKTGGDLDLIIDTDHIDAVSMSFSAPRDIIIKALVQTTVPGANIEFHADTDHDGSGGVWLQDIGKVVSAGNVLIEGSNLFATGGLGAPFDSVRIDADGAGDDQVVAAGNVVIRPNSFASVPAASDVIIEGIVRSSGAGNVDIFAKDTIELASTLGSAGGSITLHAPVILTGDSSVTSSGAGAIDFQKAIDSAAGQNFDLTVATGTGAVTFEAAVGAEQPLASLDVQVSGSILAASTIHVAETLDLLAADGVTLNDNATAAGATTIDADTDHDGIGLFSLATGKSLVTGGNPLSITAADIDLDGSLNSGAATTLLQTGSTGRAVNLGTDAAGAMGLTGAEIDRITAGAIQVGRRDALPSGNITISADISPLHTTILHLLTGGGISETGGRLLVANVALESDGPADLSLDNAIGVLAARVYGAGNAFAFTNAAGLTIGQVDGLAGLTTAAGDAVLDLAGDGDQQAGADIKVGGLRVTTPGAIDFSNAGNDAATLAATTGEDFRYRDANDVSTGIVEGLSGVTAPGQLVSLASVAGGITDGNGADANITAHDTALRAAAGIGSDDELETAVSILAAENTTSGSIRIHNSTGALLTIGTVDGLAGVSNTGGGDIDIVNSSPMDVNAPVLNAGGGNITLTTEGTGAPGDDLTIKSQIHATGGSGDIHLNAGTDLVIIDSGLGVDLMTQGDGEIFGVAQRVDSIASNVIIQTGVGAISTLSPALAGVFAPQIGSDGIVHVFGSFGDPGAHNFTIVVTWGDGTSDTFFFDDPGAFEFTHFYARNPNAADQSALIPITVTLFDDPNSHFIGMQQPSFVFFFNETDFQEVGNEFQRATIFASAPGEGLGFIRIDTTLRVPPLLFPPVQVVSYIVEQTSPVSSQNENIETLAGSLEVGNVEARQVILQIISPDGKVVGTAELDEAVLDDLPKLFRRLPDGHYKIFLKEVGEQRLRLLLDVHLRGGRPADEVENGQDEAPGAVVDPAVQNDAALGDTAEGALRTASTSASSPDAGGTGATLEVETAAAIPTDVTVERDRAVPLERGFDHETIRSSPLSGVAAAGAAFAAVAGARSWEDRLQEVLPGAEWSRAARLARRVRRNVVRSPFRRRNSKL